MVSCILALGSNLGERAGTLQAAVARLAATEGIEVLKVSDTAVTKPVGGPAGQPDFLNLVVRIDTDLAPRELLLACQEIEAAHHRTREVRWGPRTLDIDVITYGDETSEDPVLTLPHPRAATRGFVLLPWSWMEPDALLSGKPVASLAAAAADTPDIVRAEAGA
ncbi:2-amino-4-hydroxy-6-hydroxymethyldihydropteridine diphosphokinase [Paeniglutamicibacter sp. ABSL32-1]|uniref:2-amino-4-hydroxy-6- hydroxymethyldihydropteridine diphosphokinase n=1 Tax=Paeniglutamicibacter quisquiliarum TaxID=2849498 RepID=UPI001C2DAAD3|nr:2-amino-4-hydroxy-6-hydroxymethyldihydropteridine diphosphokinase [Paeniglutamicibacter quisquiliarum]MBV1781122.1 2-amino-4-hydroxy-6-hydroxymethyldihydropteridine diphosphokinase [Paeniglutamicibacter quisquiliarum]